MYRKSVLVQLIFISLVIWGITSCGNQEPNKEKGKKTAEIPSDIRSISSEIEKDSRNPELYYRRAQMYLQSKDPVLALPDIDDAIRLDSIDPMYHYTKARILYALNRTLAAEQSYVKSIELKSDFEEAKMKLAELYLIVKEHQKSIDLLNDVVASNKRNAPAFFFRGMNQKEMGDTGKAIASFQRAFETDNAFYDAAIQLGLLYTAKKNPIALEYLNAAIKMQPRSIEAYFSRAYYYQEMKDFQKALSDYKKVIDLDPANSDAYYNVGVINYEVKQYAAAVKSLDYCIQMNAEMPEAYFMRGLAYEKLGDKAEALLNFEHVRRMGVVSDELRQALKRVK
jgi:tetratricopeptide (TPR) repeat protein